MPKTTSKDSSALRRTMASGPAFGLAVFATDADLIRLAKVVCPTLTDDEYKQAADKLREELQKF